MEKNGIKISTSEYWIKFQNEEFSLQKYVSLELVNDSVTMRNIFSFSYSEF